MEMFNRTKFTDNFQIVIVHEQKAKKLFLEMIPDEIFYLVYFFSQIQVEFLRLLSSYELLFLRKAITLEALLLASSC